MENEPAETPEIVPEPTNTFEQELKECQDKYLRLLAETENMRKRLQKEKQESIRFATESLILDFLIPLENLETALKFTEQMSDEVKNWAHGFQMIASQFKNVLENYGVSAFNSKGSIFNPELHEAIEVIETDDHPEGTIVEEFNKGYKGKAGTIRAARVKVSKRPTKPLNDK